MGHLSGCRASRARMYVRRSMTTPPDLAPDFALERPLPRTPFGNAWAARAVDGRAVTVVVLAPELVGLVGDRARLVAGSPGGATLLEPLRVIDAPDGRLAVVLPREDRTPASVRLALGRTFATADVADAARALGAAMHAAHADGTRHGALAPGMLYLGDGKPARAIGHGWIEAFVAAGADRGAVLLSVGARTFAAPELAHDGVSPTAASDVHALGATLYACLTGRPPFGGRTTAMIMANVLADEGLTGEMPAYRRDAGAAPAVTTERLTQVLLRAVERAPDDRWPTAAGFVAALDGRVATPSPTLTQPRSTPARMRMAVRAATRSALGAFLQGRFLARLLSRHELR